MAAVAGGSARGHIGRCHIGIADVALAIGERRTVSRVEREISDWNTPDRSPVYRVFPFSSTPYIPSLCRPAQSFIGISEGLGGCGRPQVRQDSCATGGMRFTGVTGRKGDTVPFQRS